MFRHSAVIALLFVATEALHLRPREEGRVTAHAMTDADWEAMRVERMAAREADLAEKKAAWEALQAKQKAAWEAAQAEKKAAWEAQLSAKIEAMKLAAESKAESTEEDREAKWAARAAELGLDSGLTFADWQVNRDAWLAANEGMKTKDYWNHLAHPL